LIEDAAEGGIGNGVIGKPEVGMVEEIEKLEAHAERALSQWGTGVFFMIAKSVVT
jgi:hypothetical protein